MPPRRPSKALDLISEWTHEQRTSAWEKLWNKILSDVLSDSKGTPDSQVKGTSVTNRGVEESVMPDSTDSKSPVLTVEEARLLLRLSRNSMYAAIARQEVPHLKIGRRILIPRKALERLMDGFHE